MGAVEDKLQEIQQRHDLQESLGAAALQSYNTNPEAYAKQLQLSQKSGLPVDTLPDLTDEAKLRVLSGDFRDLPNRAPATAKYIAENHRAAKIMLDQTEEMGAIERFARNLASGVVTTIGSGLSGSGANLNALHRLLIEQMVQEQRSLGVDMPESDIAAAKKAVGTGDPLKAIGDPIKKYGKDLSPQDELTFFDQVVQGVGQIAVQVPTFAASAPLGIAMMWGQGADQMAEKIAKDKVAQKTDQALQDLEVLSGGAITAVTEWAASKLLLKPPQLLALKNRLLNYSAKVGLGTAEEGIQEFSENILQDLTHIALTNPESKVAFMEAVEAGGVGAVVGAIASGVINGALHIRGRKMQMALQDLSDASKEQKVRERDPGTYQGFADTVAGHLAATSDGAVENLYIDANVFAQTMTDAQIDPAQAVEAMGFDPQAYEEARVTGGDVVIPLNDFIGKVAGTEVGDMLAPHLRSAPEAVSITEMEEAAKLGGDFQAKADEIEAKKEDLKAYRASVNEVQKNLYDQIAQTGVYSPSVARTYASFVRDFYVAQAATSGVTPSEFYAAYPYKITSGELGETLHQPLSTRLPSGVKATEDPMESLLTVSYEAAKSHPESFAKTVEALTKLPNMRKLTGKGAKDPNRNAEAFIDHAVKNLIFLHNLMPEELRSRAEAWYDGGHQAVAAWAERYGLSEMQVAGVIASLSPQNDWFQNLSQAERVLDILSGQRQYVWDAQMDAFADRLVEAGQDKDFIDAARGKSLAEVMPEPPIAARWIRAYDETHNAQAYKVFTPEGGTVDTVKTLSGDDRKNTWRYYLPIAKAVAIVNDGSAKNVSRQLGQEHKVRNFYNNLFDPSSPLFATIDTHAVAAALLRPVAGSDLEVAQNFGSGKGVSTSKETGVRGAYPLYMEAYRRAAEQVGILPRQMQSITWEAVRGLFDTGKKQHIKEDANAIWKRYKKGEIEQEQAQQEILGLSGGITLPNWASSPYTTKLDRTYRSGIITTLTETARANPDGFTIDVSDGTSKTTGYAVAPSKMTEFKTEELTEEILSEYLDKFRVVFQNDPRACFGGWFNQATGQYVLDVSYVVESEEEALYLAELGNQDAIFHLDNFEEIKTNDGIQKLKDSGVYSESARDGLRGIQEGLHREIQRRGPASETLYQGARRRSAQTASAERAGAPRGISAVGVHYSKEARTELDSSFFGTGSPSSEAARLTGQKDLQDRIYFYLNTGKGIRPEPYVGRNAHVAQLDNLYDLTVDPLDLKKTAKSANDLERAIMASGYDGYFNRAYGVAIMLGKRIIPAKPIEDVSQIPLVEPPQLSPAQILSEELRANKDLPQGAMAGPRWLSWLEDEPGVYQKLEDAGLIDKLKKYDKPLSRYEIPFLEQAAKRGGFDPTSLTTILTQQADFSTFLHESAHFFLTTYAAMASDPNASPRVQQDMQTLLDWFGVADLATWNNMTLEEQRQHHEAFAYNFEQYLFEGKSPNIKMQTVFERFSAWLKRIYVSIRDELNTIYRQEHGIDLPILTGEVKQVMDRMLASDKQIQQAEAVRGMSPIFSTQEDAGMTDEEWAAYQDLQREAHEEALTKHQTASVRQMKWLEGAKSKALKALQAQTKETRKAVMAEVTKEVEQKEIYRAQQALKDAKEAAEKLAVADAFGYSSVENLKLAIEAAPKKAFLIKELTDRRMLEEHGELTDPKALANAVDMAVHNEARARFIGVELRHLSKTQRPVRVMQEAARQAARKILGNKMIKDIRPSDYTAAEARAALAAEKAMKEGDTATATQAKEHQLLQNMLASEAFKSREEVAKAGESFKKVFTSDKKLGKSRDMNYVNAARAILAHYGFGTSEEPAPFYLSKIKAYDPEFYAEIEPMITAHQAQPVKINELRLNDFLDLNDQVKALWHLSRRNKQIEINGQLMDRKEVVGLLNDEIRELNTSTGRPGYTKAMTKWEKAQLRLMGIRASLRRVEAWADAMDKGDPNGPFRTYIWNPISEAVTQYRMAKLDYMEKYIGLLEGIEPLLAGKEIDATEIGYTFSPQELLHAILHTGNYSNKKKLLLGRGWATLSPDGQLMDTKQWDAFIARAQKEGILTKAHYDFAQAVWDLLERMKPAAQKAHRQMYGFYFNEVTANPFDTAFGTYAGGYVPAIVDPNMVTEGAMRNEQETSLVDNSFMFPTTGRGFTKARVDNYTRPLLLNLGYLASHMDKVLRFTHIEPRVKDVARIVKTNRAFASEMDEFDQTVRNDMLVPWLQRTAMQMVSIPSKGQGGRAADAVFSWLRRTTGIQMMVANVTNTLQQFTGISISALKVRPSLLRNALWQYIKQPKDTVAMISEKSDYMKTRVNSDQYELQRTMDELLLNPDKFDKVKVFAEKHGYFMQRATQGVVDTITWVGAYNEAIEESLDEKEAVRRADAAVRMTQGSFAPEDVSRIETGSAFMRAFTQFYSYFNMQANILGTEFLNTVRNLGVKKGAGRLLYIYAFGFMVPAVLSEMIVQAAGGFDAGDDDDYDLWDAMRLFFMAQARPLAAMVPGMGQLATAGLNRMNNNYYDDRISTSPAVSLIESSVNAPFSLYKAIAEDGSNKRAARDVLTLLGAISGLPLGQIAKPLGYALDVEQGKANPQSGSDYARGLLSGKDVNRKQ